MTHLMLRLLSIATIAALGFGYLGILHPLGDSLSMFRLSLACVAFGLGVMLIWPIRDTKPGLWVIVVACAAGFGPAIDRLGILSTQYPPYDATYILYQKNLLYQANSPQAILDEIEHISPDFITFQEVSNANHAQIYGPLTDEYELAFCPFSGVGGVAIASRMPLVVDTIICTPGSGFVAAQTITPDGLMWLVSIHLHWPWPFDQPNQIQHILPQLAALDGPIIIGGDFNMGPRSYIMGEIARATGTRPLPQGQPTYEFGDPNRRPRIGVEIDHILAPYTNRAQAQLGDYAGSDHRSVIGWFAM
jgi:endonuclease/exonuclease/phosphatase (EEP) superfamily protein YafD